MNTSVKEKCEQRLQNYIDSINLREPKQIVTNPQIMTYQLWLYDITVKECYADMENYIKKCCKLYEEYEADICTVPLINPVEALEVLNRDTFFISADGYEIQHHENVSMREDEYDALIADPWKFLIETDFPRKFPALGGEYPESYELMKKSLDLFRKSKRYIIEYCKYAQKNYGVPSVTAAKMYPPFDLIFDRLRGIKGTLLDLRRCPEKIKAACESLLDLYMPALDGSVSDIPHAMLMVHAPTFLSEKQFSDYFWPTCKKMLMKVSDQGSKTLICGEGNMERTYDYMYDLPKASIIYSPEKEDPVFSKKKLGDKVAVLGGYPIEYLKYKSVDECIEKAKYILDECAPGGGYIFGLNLAALAPNDVNPVNLREVLHFVHEYR